MQEYANDIDFRLKSICDEAKVKHPTIISESGRAVVAYHSVLVFNVLGVSGFDGFVTPDTVPENAPQPLTDLFWTSRNINKKNFVEAYHDALQLREDAMNLFNLGYLTLELRSVTESLYWTICSRVLKMIDELDYVPDELKNLESLISDTYFCNYSIFQSMPDSWAIRQLFPILPIHRLTEKPTRRAIWPTLPAIQTARWTVSLICTTSRRFCHCIRTLAMVTAWRYFWLARIRKSWATCTICWATPTRCT